MLSVNDIVLAGVLREENRNEVNHSFSRRVVNDIVLLMLKLNILYLMQV